MKTYEQQLNHLIELSKNEGFKAQAWYRAKELDKDESGLWAGIANELKNAMQKYNEEQKRTGG